jgi:hypothetical protein
MQTKGGLTAIIGVRDPHATADHAPPLEAAVIALVAGVHDRARVDEAITYDALAVALLAQPSDGDAGLLPTHYQIGMVLSHDSKEEVLQVEMTKVRKIGNSSPRLSPEIGAERRS